MERRQALALAAAVTGTLGTAIVAVAAVGGLSVLGFGAAHHATQLSSLASYQSGAGGAGGVVTRTKDVYDRVTVEGVQTAASRRSAGLVSAAAPALSNGTAAPGPAMTVPRSGAVKSHQHRTPKAVPRSTARTPATTPTTEPAPAVEAPETPAPTTTTTQPPATTTAVAPVTTTTRPRGVPADWPPGKPIPPMPPNCRHPQLEDNGVWNCDD